MRAAPWIATTGIAPAWTVLAWIAVLGAGMMLGAGARADRLVLLDGQSIEGTIIQLTRNTVTMRPAIGGMRQIPRTRLRAVELDLVGGDVALGRLLEWVDGRHVIATERERLTIDAGRVVARTPLGPDAAPIPLAATAIVTPAPPTANPGPSGAADAPTVAVAVEVSVESAEALVFHIRLSPPARQPVVLIYATVDETAAAGSDYHSRQGVMTLAPGTTETELLVPLIDDHMAEPTEHLLLFVTTNPEVASVPEPWNRATIEDDD